MDHLFAEFQPVSKDSWHQQIAIDLKGKSLADLQWHLGSDFVLDPFYVRQDVAHLPSSLLQSLTSERSWEIGEDHPVDDCKTAQQHAIEGLLGGISSPRFNIQRSLQHQDWQVLLEGIHLPYIYPQFSLDYADANLLEAYHQFSPILLKQGADLATQKGAFLLSDTKQQSQQFQEIAALIASRELPEKFKILHINGTAYYEGHERIADELSQILALASDCFFSLLEKGVNPSVLMARTQVSVSIGSSFFVEIAKLRALQWLFVELQKAYEIPVSLPFLDVYFAQNAYDENTHTNMIRSTTLAMSAIFGGCQRLTVMPADGAEASAFTRRIARNVQHILQMESYLDRATDASAGSYYIDTLTHLFAEKAWAKFQLLEKKKTS